MSVKICGHIINWQKPIKFYALLKSFVLLIALGSMFVSTTIFAADLSQSCKASPSGAPPCLPQHTQSMDKGLPAQEEGVTRTQRPAGHSSVSAMALVIALGLVNIQGPVERTAASLQDISPSSGTASQPRTAVEKEK